MQRANLARPSPPHLPFEALLESSEEPHRHYPRPRARCRPGRARPLFAGARRPGLEGACQLLPGAALCFLILAHVAYYFPRVVDDVFISLRYAENLATGHGAVYNEGERVEGYSSPAWMLLQTLGIAWLEPVTFTKAIGIACLIATAFGARAVTRQLLRRRGLAVLIPAYACAASSYLVDWTVLGLDAAPRRGDRPLPSRALERDRVAVTQGERARRARGRDARHVAPRVSALRRRELRRSVRVRTDAGHVDGSRAAPLANRGGGRRGPRRPPRAPLRLLR